MPEPTTEETKTEAQVKASNEAEEAKWQGDFKEEDLHVPYKREAAPKDEATTTETDEDNDSDKEDDASQEAEPAPVVTMQDPGEFKAPDLAFEVTLKDGKTVKVSTPEEADTLSEDPENFETPKQLLDFIKKANKMERSLDQALEKWQTQKDTFEEQTATASQRQETLVTMENEFKYLVGKGLMPKIDKQYLDADWSDPEIAKQSGVKEQVELLNYMVKENETRARAKVAPLKSVVDAYNAWQLDSGRKQAEADKKAEGEARKTAGARVAGVSPSQQAPYVPKGIAVGNPNILKRGQAQWDD